MRPWRSGRRPTKRIPKVASKPPVPTTISKKYIEKTEKFPPFLYVQGDEDAIIPMAQGLRFCDQLRACGGRADFLKSAGGEHGPGVWSKEMLDYVVSFFKAYIG